MKVLHVITALEKGGAETNLYRLATGTNNNVKNYIISLKKNCYYEEKLIEKKIQVYSFNFNNIFLLLSNFYKIIKLIYTIRPDIINTWMYHANFISIILKPFIKKEIQIIWNIRHSTFNIKYTKVKTLLIIYISILFSYFIPKKIIYNSFSGKKKS